jgi:hypothetical protein
MAVDSFFFVYSLEKFLIFQVARDGTVFFLVMSLKEIVVVDKDIDRLLTSVPNPYQSST